MEKKHLRAVKGPSAPRPVCKYLGECPYYRGRRNVVDGEAGRLIASYCLDAERSRLCLRHTVLAKYGVTLEPTVAPA